MGDGSRKQGTDEPGQRPGSLAALLASLCPDCEAPMRCTGTRTWREGEWERTENTYVCDNHGVTSSTARHVGPAASDAPPQTWHRFFAEQAKRHKHPTSANADYLCVRAQTAAEVAADLQRRIDTALAYLTEQERKTGERTADGYAITLRLLGQQPQQKTSEGGRDERA